MGSGGYGTFGAPLGLLTDDRAKAIYGAYSSRKGMSEVVAAATVALADRLGADAYDLANLINFESGWNPAAVNPTSGASGLIQFMPRTAANLGTTVEAVRQMTALEQLALAERYFAPHRGRVGTVQGLYMAVFYPKAMSWSLDTQMPEIVRKANPGINTVGDYVRLANRRARLPSSDSRGGRAIESAVALAPLVSAGAAARIGGVATQGRDLAIDYRMPLLALGTLGFLGVAIVAFRVWRRHKPRE